ncbi:hypothetical protein D3C75_789070 [compost metagenome]
MVCGSRFGFRFFGGSGSCCRFFLLLLLQFLQTLQIEENGLDGINLRHIPDHGIQFGLRQLGNIENGKDSVEFFLLDVLNGRDGFDHFTVLLEQIKYHISPGRFQDAILSDAHFDEISVMSRRHGLLQHRILELVDLHGRRAAPRCSCWLRRGGCRLFFIISGYNGFQGPDNIGHIRLACAAFNNVVDHRLQSVRALEEAIKNEGIHGKLVIPHQIQHVLHLVGQLGQVFKAHCSGHAL